MEIKITSESLAGKKLMIGTPMYGGMCAGVFTRACTDLAKVCGEHNVPLAFYFLLNESLITRARNFICDEFLRSDCTHLLFVDSDIGFSYKDALTLLHLTGTEDYDIVTGPYPKKTISWEKITQAVKQGVADENPFVLENYVGDFVFNMPPEVESFRIDEPVEVMEAGTGFMMITKDALLKYKEAYPELMYRPDHVRTEHFDGSREVMAFFDTVIDPETKRYLSEDYMFSQYARKIGLKVWLCPWMRLGHMGSYTFAGSLAEMAQIGASPTASEESRVNHYKMKK